jgi:glycosyltransferase involved in cell wall biosynthesis
MNRFQFEDANTIIINATNIGFKFSGIGVYSLNILRELANLQTHLNFIVYLNKTCKPHISNIEFPDNFCLRWVSSIISPDRNFKGHILRLLYSNYLSIRHKRLLIFNTSQLEVNFFRKNQIVTIHDVIPLLFKKYHLKQYPYFRLILKFGLKYAKFVLTPSIHSKELLQQTYNISEHRIRYIHNGVRTIENKNKCPKNSAGRKYILYMGRISKMKNISNLLKAYGRIHNLTNHILVIIGNDEKLFKKELRIAGISSQIYNKIIFIQDLDEESKNEWIRNSSLFVFPSLYEGFGLPPLEAMANGCPVIVSNNSSLPEVCGDAAIYVNPYNPDEISDAILKVLDNGELRRNLIELGLKRSMQFSWGDSASEHLYVLEHVLQHSYLPENSNKIEFRPILNSTPN